MLSEANLQSRKRLLALPRALPFSRVGSRGYEDIAGGGCRVLVWPCRRAQLRKSKTVLVQDHDIFELISPLYRLRQCLVDTVDFDDRTPLFLACAKGNLGCVKVLLAAGAVADRVSADGRTPLQAAVEAGHAKVVAELIVTSRVLSGTLLVEYWEDVERSKRVAEEENNEIESKENSEARELKRELERRRADLAGPRKRILHEVEIDLEDYVFVSLPKVDVERETYDGSTPLHSAIARGYQQVVQVLLRPGGASVNRVTTSGETPLNVVAKSGHYEFVALLLARGAVDKEAALLTAVGKGDTRMVGKFRAGGTATS